MAKHTGEVNDTSIENGVVELPDDELAILKQILSYHKSNADFSKHLADKILNPNMRDIKTELDNIDSKLKSITTSVSIIGLFMLLAAIIAFLSSIPRF